MFRNNLLFGGLCLCLILSLSSKLMINMEQRQAASLLESASMLGFGLLLIRILGLTAFRVLLPALRMHPPRIMEDILLVLTYIVWGLVWLRVAGLDLSGLVTTSAVITGVVAFSMQETLGNILGGLALQLDNSVRIGDWIKVDDVRGKVVEVHWRHTAVRTNNGSLIVIPNSVLMKSKVDVYSRESKPEFRRWVNFWIEDGVPPQQVIATVQAALRQTHIAHISSERPPECIVTDYREGLIQYAVRYWLTNPAHDDGTDSAVRIHFYSALQRQSMSLAHPCMDIRLNADTERRSSARQWRRKWTCASRPCAKVALFSGLTEEELAKLAKALRNTPFVKDDIITRQGAVAHWLYLLVGGEADVWFEAEGQERVYCATLQGRRCIRRDRPADRRAARRHRHGQDRRAVLPAGQRKFRKHPAAPSRTGRRIRPRAERPQPGAGNHPQRPSRTGASTTSQLRGEHTAVFQAALSSAHGAGRKKSRISG